MVDTDYGCTVEVTRNGEEEVIWDAHKIGGDLLRRHRDSNLVISGCYSNQGDFYNYFDHIVLLVAELDVMLARVESGQLTILVKILRNGEESFLITTMSCRC